MNETETRADHIGGQGISPTKSKIEKQGEIGLILVFSLSTVFWKKEDCRVSKIN